MNSSDVVFILASAAFFIWTLRSLFFWSQIFDRYYYSVLRSQSYLERLRRTLKIFISWSSFLSWGALLVTLIAIVNDYSHFLLPLLVLVLFFGKTVIVLREISLNRISFSHFQLRTILIISFSLFSTFLLFALPLTERYVWLVILDRLIFFLVAFVVFIFTFPGELFDDLQIKRAIKKMRGIKNIKNIVVIGQGSQDISLLVYEFLRKIESVELISDSLPRSGVYAQKVLRNVNPSTKTIIFSLLSENKKTITEVLGIVQPDVIILTPETEADDLKLLLDYLHEKMKRITFVIPEKLQRVIQSSKKSRKNNIFPYSLNAKERNISFFTDIIQHKDGIAGRAVFPHDVFSFKSSMIGTHHIKHLLPALLTASLIHERFDIFTRVLSDLPPLTNTVILHRLHSGVVIIDASCIDNSEDAKEILFYVSLYKRRKIIVLGVETGDIQNTRKLAERLSLMKCNVFVTNKSNERKLRSIIHSGGICTITSIKSKDVTKIAREELSRGDIILFLGPQTAGFVERVLTQLPTNDFFH